MILDVRVGAGSTPDAVADALAAALDVSVGVDDRGNPKLVPEGGLIRVARSGYDRTIVLAEVRSGTRALADRAYEILVARTPWDVQLVDSSDDHPEDVVLRGQSTKPA